MKLNKFSRNDWIIALAISIFIFFFILLTSDLIGLVRDEGFYIKAATKTAGWTEHIVDSFSEGNFLEPFSSKSIKKYFEYNHEHPTFMKNLFGFSHYVFYKKLKILSFVNSVRIVAAFFAAAIAFFIYLMGALFYNRLTAIVAPLLFFMMPHIFFHSHLACFDVPVLFFWFGTFLLFNIYLLNRSRKLAVFIAVFYGCGMATKHNVFFIPILLFLVWIVSYIINYKQLEEREKGFLGLFRAAPLPFYLFILISLPVYIFNWPWLWYDTIGRFKWYLNFHTYHVNYTNYFFGMELSKGPFPFSYPWGMTFFTTPLPQLICFFAGIILFCIGLSKSVKKYREGQVYANFIIGSLFPIVLIALPSVPIFGGVKHFFTGFPLMLTAGLFVVIKGGEQFLSGFEKRKRFVFSGMFFVVVLISLIPLNVKFSMHGAAFFNSLIGGAQGAASVSMQRNFWGYDILPLVDVLNKNAKKGATVYVMGGYEGLNMNSFNYLKRTGIVRRDIRGTNDLKRADYAFFFYEKQNEHMLYTIYDEFKTARPLALSEEDSVLFTALFRRVDK